MSTGPKIVTISFLLLCGGVLDTPFPASPRPLEAADETVVAVQEVEIGEPLLLDATEIEADFYFWDTDVDKKHIRFFEDGNVIAFWPPGGGKYKFKLFTTMGEAAERTGTVTNYEIVVKGEVSPEPDPDNELDSQYGLALLARNEALKLDDYSEAWIISKVYKDVARQITDGELESDVGKPGLKIFAAISTELKKSFTVDQFQKWSSWGAQIGMTIGELVKEKVLQEDSQFAAVCIEIATGLDTLDTEIQPNKDIGWVIVVEETGDRTPETAAIFNNQGFSAGLSNRGIKWRWYDDDEQSADKYDEVIKGIKLPVVILQEKDGTFIEAFTLPASVGEFSEKLGGK